MRFEKPTISRNPTDNHYAPSWPGVDQLAGPSGFINEEHQGIYEATKELPGWQDPGDSLKLYEAAYFSGAVILEVGVFGGRSATVELRGALAAQKAHGGPAPQFFGVDPDLNAYSRTMGTLRAQGLAADTGPGDIEEVVVTGSRIKRQDYTSISPLVRSRMATISS